MKKFIVNSVIVGTTRFKTAFASSALQTGAEHCQQRFYEVYSVLQLELTKLLAFARRYVIGSKDLC